MTRSAKDTSVGADRPAAEHADSLRVDLPRHPLAPSIGAGLRSRLGSVDVDSGTMVIATGEFPDGGEWAAPCVADGALWSATGYGDGTYPVVALVDSDGNLRSVEVVFFSLALEAAARRAVDDERAGSPRKRSSSPTTPEPSSSRCGRLSVGTYTIRSVSSRGSGTRGSLPIIPRSTRNPRRSVSSKSGAGLPSATPATAMRATRLPFPAVRT